MRIPATVRNWYAEWQTWRSRKHRSNWDAGPRDVLAELIEHNRIRKARKLP